MKEIVNEEQLLMIDGGGTKITSSIISAVTGAAKIILEIGRSAGGAIRRSVTHNNCSL